MKQNSLRLSITLSLTLFWSLVHSSSALAHDTIYLRSPIDGYIVEMSKIGQTISEGSSANSWVRLASPEVSSCSSAPFHLDFSKDGSLEKIDVELPADGAAVAAHVFSPLIEKEIAAATARLNLTKEKLKLIEGEIEHARIANAEELEFVANRQQVEKRFTDAQLAIAAKTPDQQDEMPAPVVGALTQEINSMRAKERSVIARAQNRFVEHDLAVLKKSAEQDVSAARCELDILEATKALGVVYCPTKCKIVEVHAISGQWITKGDPIVSFRPLN